LQLLDEKKAGNMENIEFGERSIVADHFVVCSGTSNTHIKSIADGLLVEGRDKGLKKGSVEGYSQAKWILIDFGDIVVHIFAPEEREFYDVESLWKQTEEKLHRTVKSERTEPAGD